MKKLLTVEEIALWCWKNRRGKAFYGFKNAGTIFREIQRAVAANSICVVTDIENNIIGVATGTPDSIYKVMFIDDILCLNRIARQSLVRNFLNLWPGWDIQARRHGELVRYKNTSKFLSKLLNYGN